VLRRILLGISLAVLIGGLLALVPRFDRSSHRIRAAAFTTRMDFGPAAATTTSTTATTAPPPWPGPDVEREVWVGGQPVQGKTVALTFDDGPQPTYTPEVLQILQDEGVKATFCVVGYAIGWDPNLLKAEANAGDVICDHTAHHVLHLDRAKHDQVAQEINEGADDIRNVLGADPRFFRPPGGALSPDIIATAHARGMRVLGWDDDPRDYRRLSANQLLARILGQVRPGALILLHDGGGNRATTVAILRPLIDRLKADGWTFVVPG
jgi:peptidoglycan-N-acetylglucosamine deacetylase